MHDNASTRQLERIQRGWRAQDVADALQTIRDVAGEYDRFAFAHDAPPEVGAGYNRILNACALLGQTLEDLEESIERELWQPERRTAVGS